MPKSFSRTAVDLFCECPRCFYLLHKKGLRRPAGYPFTLNAAVDKLAKVEFDGYRERQVPHPIMEGLDMVPLQHAELENWRNNKIGIACEYEGYRFYGAVDDVWKDSIDPELWHVVDYKATAKKDPVISLDASAAHHQSYQRQVSFYTWLFAQNNYPVSEISYFYYVTGDNTLDCFEDTLHFRTHLIAYNCDLNWIEPTLDSLIACYEEENIPNSKEGCSFCMYVSKYNELIYKHT